MPMQRQTLTKIINTTHGKTTQMNNTFENFEKLYGTSELLKAIISIQNEILVDKGITTTNELKSRLQKELICRPCRPEKTTNDSIRSNLPIKEREELKTTKCSKNTKKEIFDKLYTRWRCSLDPIIAFRTNSFANKEKQIEKDMEEIRTLFAQLEYIFYQEEKNKKTSHLS